MIRLFLAIGALIIGLVTVTVMDFVLPETPAIILLDKGGDTYPYSVQNVMWLAFFIGLSELIFRYLNLRQERRHLGFHYLPEDETTILVKSMLPKIFKGVSSSRDSERAFLPSLIRRSITAFQTTNSVENASAVLNSSIELRSHDLDLSYSMIRYILWVIPTLGFIGTVVGIALALNYAGEPGRSTDPTLLTELTRKLAVAFYTTLVALLMSSVLLLFMHIVQEIEERIINRCGQYCLDNLINRLYKTDD